MGAQEAESGGKRAPDSAPISPRIDVGMDDQMNVVIEQEHGYR